MDLFLPIEERRDILREMGKVWHLRFFVETGTNNGDTVAALLDDFDALYSVELDQGLYENAVRRFKDNQNVFIVPGDSGKWLQRLVPLFKEPALFWLDGHYSGPGTARGMTSTPIREELDAVFQAPKGSVVLIDDARCFEGGAEHNLYEHYAEYPSIDSVAVEAIKNGFTFELDNDIMYLTP